MSSGDELFRTVDTTLKSDGLGSFSSQTVSCGSINTVRVKRPHGSTKTVVKEACTQNNVSLSSKEDNEIDGEPQDGTLLREINVLITKLINILFSIHIIKGVIICDKINAGCHSVILKAKTRDTLKGIDYHYQSFHGASGDSKCINEEQALRGGRVLIL